ncbi:MAG: sigma 54-interacting transcriptional regulator [Oscillospiraceae bacterium]|nr:sigma 54-interacting transcriptional regulator [Oscillospiraceae bacterium]
MEDYHQAEQDLLFGVLDALPCPAALLNREGQPAYMNPKGELCKLPSYEVSAVAQVRDCLRDGAPHAGWAELRALPDPGQDAPADRLSGFAEAYPVRVDGHLLGVLLLLRPEVGSSEGYDSLPYVSEAILSLRAKLSRLSAIGVPALFLGEPGTGRASFARMLHEISLPGDPFSPVACRTKEQSELERELFGDIPHPGVLRALKGTVFLSGIEELPLPFQRRLLALLQSRIFPDGMPFLVRLSASGPPDLENMAASGRFDPGLYARLSVMPARIPPLRDRPEDILPAARCFLTRYATLSDAPSADFSKESCRILMSHTWPGNVKELEDAVVSALSQCTGDVILPEHLPVGTAGAKLDLHEQRQGFTRRRIEEALALHGNTVEGKRIAAKELGIGLSTLYRLLGEKKPNRRENK